MHVGIIITFVMAIFSDDLLAAHFRDGGFLAHKGMQESIVLPQLPPEGEEFKVNLKGQWPEVAPSSTCMAPLDYSEVVVYADNRVQIVSFPRRDSAYCDQPPANWDFDVVIPSDAWGAVDEDGYLLIEHMLYSGINVMTSIQQDFDMRLGRHEVPAFIDSGFWISKDLPNEGILIEQQGNRVLFYGLRYDRNPQFSDDGEPVWQLVSGEMYGNSALGRSYRYDWPMDENGMPSESPTEEELLTANDSGSIVVNDYNHIRVFTESTGVLGIYKDYERFVFGFDKGRLPTYVPPLDGFWSLHGFVGQTPLFTAKLEFLQGQAIAANQYQFRSVDANWLATCKLTASRLGNCSIVRSSDDTRFDFALSDFQGNLAGGDMLLNDGQSIDAVLIREPWELPPMTSSASALDDR